MIMATVFLSCNREDAAPGKEIIPPQKMVDILTDIHIAESGTDSRGYNSIQLNQMVYRKYEDIMKKHGTSFSVFKASFDYYLSHPDQFDEIYQEIVNRLTALEGKSKARSPSLKKDGVDTIPAR